MKTNWSRNTRKVFNGTGSGLTVGQLVGYKDHAGTSSFLVNIAKTHGLKLAFEYDVNILDTYPQQERNQDL